MGLRLRLDGPDPTYRLVGRVADRAVHRPEKASTLLVRCYVYEQLLPQPDPRPDGTEVAHSLWLALCHECITVKHTSCVQGGVHRDDTAPG